MTSEYLQPKVSIGMPVCNGARWLSDAIQSHLAQTFDDFELVISDNCSDDGSWEICLAWAARDPRIRVSRTRQRVGAFENFNIVYRQSRGEYFRWASCNDVSLPTLLEKAVAVLDADPRVVLCCTRCDLIDERGELIEHDPVSMHLDDPHPIVRWTTFLRRVKLNNAEQGLIRRAVLARTMLQRNFYNNDTWMVAELALYGQFHEIPEFLFQRRMTHGAATRLRSTKELLLFWAPGGEGMRLQALRRLRAQARMILKAPIGWREKATLVRCCLRFVRWSADQRFRAILQR
jgi:glycosyltransferase involved in cell wall biosynthesis